MTSLGLKLRPYNKQYYTCFLKSKISLMNLKSRNILLSVMTKNFWFCISGLFDELLPLREDLLLGDPRSLYLALIASQTHMQIEMYVQTLPIPPNLICKLLPRDSLSLPDSYTATLNEYLSIVLDSEVSPVFIWLPRFSWQ